MKRTSIVVLCILVTGCALWTGFKDSFKTVPGQRATMPIRESVLGSSLTVSVRILDGDFRPICLLPDASNEISCLFYLGYLESGMVGHPDGYLFLGFDTARQACSEATWTLGMSYSRDVLDACTRALMTQRWMIDGEYGKEGE